MTGYDPAAPALLHLAWVAAGVAAMLLLGGLAGLLLRRLATDEAVHRLADDVGRRTVAWWMMAVPLFAALFAGGTAILVLFALLSFLALREFITLAPTRRADHRTLFWAFFVIIPLQYLLIGSRWYGMFIAFIPVWCFLFIAIRSTLSGDPIRYLERTAKIQWGLMLCVYCLSHVPAFLLLDPPGFAGRQAELLLWLLLVVQLSDVLQYVWGKALGRHHLAPRLSPGKTWEGLLGGGASAAGLGAALWWLTPFSPLQALAMASGAVALGFAGGVVMSAIKRDAGVKDFGRLLPGHGGILDRVDSLTFAAPAIFHLTRFYFS